MQGTLYKPEISRKTQTNVFQEDTDLQDQKTGGFLNSEIFWTGVLHSEKRRMVIKKRTEYGMTKIVIGWVHF